MRAGVAAGGQHALELAAGDDVEAAAAAREPSAAPPGSSSPSPHSRSGGRGRPARADRRRAPARIDGAASRRRAACRSGARRSATAHVLRAKSASSRQAMRGRAGQALTAATRRARPPTPRRWPARPAAASAGPSGRRRASKAITRPWRWPTRRRPPPLHSNDRFAHATDSIDHELPRRSSKSFPMPSTTRRAARRAGRASRRRSIACSQDDVIDIDAQPHRRPARARAFRTAARSSSTRSRRCTSSGWPRAPAATTSSTSDGRWIDGRDGREFFERCRPARARRAAAAALRALSAADAQRLNRSRMLLRSSSLGAAGAALVVQAEAAHAGAARVLLVVPLAADVDARPRAALRLLHRHALQRVLHVVDPDRQRQAAAGLAVAELARRVVADPDDADDVLAASRRTRRRCESLVVPVLP